MFKSFAFLAVAATVQTAFVFTDGDCGSAVAKFGTLQGRVQCNYKHQASKHYSLSAAGVHTMTAFENDWPHSADANGKNPRTEITLRDDFSYTKKDRAEFSGSAWITTDSTTPFSFFQIKHDGTQGTSATSAMLNHKNGDLWYYDNGFKIKDNVKGRWIPFRVLHDGPSRKMTIWVDGVQVKEDRSGRFLADSTVNDFHFKFGPYGKQVRDPNSSKAFTAKFKDIKVTINRNVIAEAAFLE
jgi:hypothetical protein